MRDPMRDRIGRALGAALLAAVLAMTGCASLLERGRSVSEPHSSRFWESEAAGTLRAEGHQDVVNDLLILIGQHTEDATLRLYGADDVLAAADILESAAVEIQQGTPLGSYAVSYIISSAREQKGYHEVKIQIGYRRTLEQLQAVVNATSPEAVYRLLEMALDEGRTELAVRIGYWDEDGREQVEEAVARLREDRGAGDAPPWKIEYHPGDGPVGLIEFLLDPPLPSISDTGMGSDGAARGPLSSGTAPAPTGGTPSSGTAPASSEGTPSSGTAPAPTEGTTSSSGTLPAGTGSVSSSGTGRVSSSGTLSSGAGTLPSA